MADGCTEKRPYRKNCWRSSAGTSDRCSATSHNASGPERHRNRSLPGVEMAAEVTAAREKITALVSPYLRSRRAFPARAGSAVGVASQRDDESLAKIRCGDRPSTGSGG